MKPTKCKYTTLHQICNLIPRGLVTRLAKKHGVDKKSRSFTPWSHVVSLLHSQLAHSISLNDIADTLQNQSGSLATIRGAEPPSRNGLSHASKVRNADMAEELFWEMLAYIQDIHPSFGSGHRYSGLPNRFKRTIYAIDSTTIQLVANCMDWAKHRRRKAAAKCHMQLNMQTFLPQFAIVKAANTHDTTEAKELCANLEDGEIALFDKAYVDFPHLHSLDGRGVFWVTRAKSNMSYRVVGQHREPKGNIRRDVLLELTTEKSFNAYPKPLRLVEADVEINGKMKTMIFITNNLKWASRSVCDLYKCRWGVEVFFKQIKQTLQLADFLGYSENAVRWQVWMAMLTYLLLRFVSFLGKWDKSFRRLFTLIRGVLFSRLDIFSVMECCGTARGSPRFVSVPHQTYLPGFEMFEKL
ncbi:MAG: IS4 family transposase [Bacteroidota bacterium]|nr:IS4 family transposase [Bacteroidota bacterium]